MTDGLNCSQVIRLFDQLGFEIVETSMGLAIKFDASHAFVFSVVTGSPYLDADFFPFTAKGLTKIFNSALSDQPVWGLFDGDSYGFTPRNISRQRQFVFSGPKFVIPVEIESEDDASSWVTRARRVLTEPENFIMLRIESWKSGHGLEPLLEYLACTVFRSCGYLVETQIPLSATTGSPDFLAIRQDHVLKELKNSFKGIKCGLHIIELGLLFRNLDFQSTWPVHKSMGVNSSAISVVGEAKVGGSSPATQLAKYDSTGFFTHLIALLDRPLSSGLGASGVLQISKDGVLDFTFPENHASVTNSLRVSMYIDWYEFVSKCYLLSNLEAEQIHALLQKKEQPKEQRRKGNSVAAIVTHLARILDTKTIVESVANGIQ